MIQFLIGAVCGIAFTSTLILVLACANMEGRHDHMDDEIYKQDWENEDE